jgi:hypothetical protein
MIRSSLILLACVLGAVSLRAQTTSWTNTAGDSSWNNAGNWSNGVPGTSTAVTIGVQPSGNIIGIDTGAPANQIGSLTFGASLTGSFTLTNAGIERLAIGSGLTNASGFTLELALPLALAFAQNVATGGGLLFSSGLTLGAAVNVSGAGRLTLGSGTQTVVSIGAANYGRFAGSGLLAYTGSNLVFDFSQSAAGGSSWDLVDDTIASGGFAGVSFAGSVYQGALTQTSPGVWQATVGGAAWTYTEATGVLSNVPEPGCAALLLAGTACAGWSRRRRVSR